MKVVKCCVWCGKVYLGEKKGALCSNECKGYYARTSTKEKLLLFAEMEKKQRSPKRSCRCYDPKTHNCHALTGLWCEWEDCKFYRRADNEQEESVGQRDLPVLP